MSSCLSSVRWKLFNILGNYLSYRKETNRMNKGNTYLNTTFACVSHKMLVKTIYQRRDTSKHTDINITGATSKRASGTLCLRVSQKRKNTKSCVLRWQPVKKLYIWELFWKNYKLSGRKLESFERPTVALLVLVFLWITSDWTKQIQTLCIKFLKHISDLLEFIFHTWSGNIAAQNQLYRW